MNEQEARRLAISIWEQDDTMGILCHPTLVNAATDVIYKFANKDKTPHSYTADNKPVYGEDEQKDDIHMDVAFGKDGGYAISAYADMPDVEENVSVIATNNDRYSNKEGIDVSVETARTYVYANGEEYTVKNPSVLYVRDSGGHRVLDGTYAHIIRSGWIAIKIFEAELEF